MWDGTFVKKVGIEKGSNDLKAGGIKLTQKLYLLSKLTFISKFTLGS